jgi:hypothetical protein
LIRNVIFRLYSNSQRKRERERERERERNLFGYLSKIEDLQTLHEKKEGSLEFWA